jgi:hypothetical protein
METVTIKKENLFHAYNNACDEVQTILHQIFGKETFEKNLQIGDVVEINDFSYTMGGDGIHPNGSTFKNNKARIYGFGVFPSETSLSDSNKFSNDTAIITYEKNELMFIRKRFLKKIF